MLNVEVLCDTCRQHLACRHVDESPGRKRHLCANCPYPVTDLQDVDLTAHLLLKGVCEQCGGQAFSVLGIPGPERRVYCSACSKK
jgi:protein-arginine kinase activator protein McsA